MLHQFYCRLWCAICFLVREKSDVALTFTYAHVIQILCFYNRKRFCRTLRKNDVPTTSSIRLLDTNSRSFKMFIGRQTPGPVK